MKIPGNILILLFLATALLASCKESVPTPSMSPTPFAATSTSPATVPPPTNTALPTMDFYTPTFAAAPSTKPFLPTEAAISIPGGVVYYHFVNLDNYAPSQGSVVVMPDNLILAPTQLDQAYGSDVVADLRNALEAVFKDERNYWVSDKLKIEQISYSGGHAQVALEGEYYAVAPVVLTAARAQILMSLFANAAVGSATVTINGENIANISISNSMDARPADYTYTRAEIESFMSENAYAGP